MNQGRLRQYHKPRQGTPAEEEELDRLLDSLDEDGPDDDSREGPETEHIQVNENGAHRKLARLRSENQRKNGMGYEIGTGLKFNEKGKIVFVNSYRTMSHSFYTAIKKSFFSGIELKLVLEIYDRSYGFHKTCTKFLSVSEIARALDASRNSVKNALRKLEEKLVVYPVERKRIYGNELCSYKVNLFFEYWKGNKPGFYSWVEKERKSYWVRQAKVTKSNKKKKKQRSS